MILKTSLSTLILSICLINSSSGISYSQVHVESEPLPVRYIQYGAPYAYSTLVRPSAQINTLPGPVPAPVPSFVPTCVSPCTIPEQSLAPIPIARASNIVVNSPYATVPVVVSPESKQAAGYEYSYVVYDESTGDHKAQRENSDGSVIRGEYSFLQPDGYVREVQYVADDVTGFNAVVKNFLPVTVEKKSKTEPSCEDKKHEALIELSQNRNEETKHEETSKHEPALEIKESHEPEPANTVHEETSEKLDHNEEINPETEPVKEHEEVHDQESTPENKTIHESEPSQEQKGASQHEQAHENEKTQESEPSQGHEEIPEPEAAHENTDNHDSKPVIEHEGADGHEPSLEKPHEVEASDEHAKVAEDLAPKETEESKHEEAPEHENKESHEPELEQSQDHDVHGIEPSEENKLSDKRDMVNPNTMPEIKVPQESDSKLKELSDLHGTENINAHPDEHKNIQDLTVPGEHNELVPYNDIIRCIQAAIKKGKDTYGAMKEEPSPLTYIILNKPC